MFGRRRTRPADDDENVIVEHGPSLAKGPALLVGSILVVFGLAGLLTNADFPNFSQNFPDGTAHGSKFLGFEVNGWTNFLCIAAGALLLFGAAQHHLAKLMSLLVGLALGAAAVIALIDGDVLGLAAANRWTKLAFGITAVVLVLNALMPRAKRRRVVEPGTTTAAGRPSYAEPTDRTGRLGRFGRTRDRDVAATGDDRTAVATGDRTAAATDDDRTAVATGDRTAATGDDRTAVASGDRTAATGDDRTAVAEREAQLNRERLAGTAEGDAPPRRV